MTRELLQQALDALEAMQMEAQARKCGLKIADDAITALREALAAPMPEPVAYGMQDEHGVFVDAISPEEQHRYPGEYKTPLYAAPPAAPAPAVPLTDEQFADMVAEASLAVDLAANPLKLLAFARAVLSAAPVVREPQIDYTVLHGFADKHRISYNELCAAVRDSLSGIGGGGNG